MITNTTATVSIINVLIYSFSFILIKQIVLNKGYRSTIYLTFEFFFSSRSLVFHINCLEFVKKRLLKDITLLK